MEETNRIAAPVSGGSLIKAPTYLRVVATTRCNLSCSYCHNEGDTHDPKELAADLLIQCLEVAVCQGIRKFKFLGGEPLVRRDLPQIVAHLRRLAPAADISVITAGCQKVEKIDDLFSAGLDRMNFSIHGFSLPAFAARQPINSNVAKLHAQRGEFIKHLLKHGKPCKINYVYTGRRDEKDLNALLDWAAPLPVVVNVLDNLDDPELDAQVLQDALIRMRGGSFLTERCEDPDSLDTRHFIWEDGLRVEIKDRQLGNLQAYAACPTCDKRKQCREGIYALRLMHSGNLQLCMDRGDIYLPLTAIIKKQGIAAGRDEWDRFFMEELNHGDNHLSYNRGARRRQDRAWEGDSQVVPVHFSSGNRRKAS